MRNMKCKVCEALRYLFRLSEKYTKTENNLRLSIAKMKGSFTLF